MVDMMNVRKYKADNSFKPGYLNHLETILEEKLPGVEDKNIERYMGYYSGHVQ